MRSRAFRWLFLALTVPGCSTPVSEYVHNGLKVGPNYREPAAPVAPAWIDSADKRVRTDSAETGAWWKVFNDPVLDKLICSANQQNLSLQEAGYLILQARAQRNIAAGELFPQRQEAVGDTLRKAESMETANHSNIRKQYFAQTDLGFNLAWELDFWGRYRRALESADANLSASIENYDQVAVTMLADVATYYVNIRTLDDQLKYARANAALQQKTLEVASTRLKGGTGTDLDVNQSKSNLAQVEALIPQLKTQLRQANNQLCTLMGIPPEDLRDRLGSEPLPIIPTQVAVGIPVDLLRRRPDVRRKERLAAAQSAQIGIAESEFYPHIALNGTFGYSAEHLDRLFTPTAFRGAFGPSFQWDILNYGRHLNDVRAQTAQFQALVAAYQNAVLTAGREVEDGLTAFLESQERVRSLMEAVQASQKAVLVAFEQYKGGTVDYNRMAWLERDLVEQEILLARSRGEVAVALIQVYRALGGGWQVHCADCEGLTLPALSVASPVRPVPIPAPLMLPPTAPSEVQAVPQSPTETPPSDLRVKMGTPRQL